MCKPETSPTDGLDHDRTTGGNQPVQHCAIIGAQKGGTTALHTWLASHRLVTASDPKELHYFDVHAHPSRDEYGKMFQPNPETRLLIDATPAYMFVPYVAAKMAQSVPDCKLVAVLREPGARAHSAWWMTVNQGDESRTFRQTIADELEAREMERLADNEQWMRSVWHDRRASVGSGLLTGPTMVLWTGLYARHLAGFRRHYSTNQFLVLFYEEVVADPDAAAVQLGEFLGLDPAPLFGGLPSENRALGQRAAALQRARSRPAGRVAGALLPPALRRALKGLAARGDNKPQIDAETATLLAEYFRGPNVALAELLGRDLPW